jgi:hypothetical protein
MTMPGQKVHQKRVPHGAPPWLSAPATARTSGRAAGRKGSGSGGGEDAHAAVGGQATGRCADVGAGGGGDV